MSRGLSECLDWSAPCAVPAWDSNTTVWVSDARHGYTRGQLVARDGNDVSVRLLDPDGGPPRDVRATLAPALAVGACAACERCNPPHLDGVPDMSLLPELNESGVLHNLRCRYSSQRVHTYSGLFLLVVNPYAELPIYGPGAVRMYTGKRRDEVPPHVFAVADEAYRRMLATGSSQSVLITGESGAGKTENTKRVIQFYAAVCRPEQKQQQQQHQRLQLEDQMVAAIPILEAFGNAKTTRNDNSSRFGKFVQVQFTRAGLVAGMRTVHYLLERSRICSRLRGERSFHVFYQLLAGATPAMREAMVLRAPENYEYLRSSECFAADQIDDARMFDETLAALALFGVTREQQDDVLRVVAAVLWMGNIRFVDDDNDEAQINTPEALEVTSRLLGVKPEVLRKGLLKRSISAGGQTVVTSQRAAMASASRDALARALYDKLFDWVVSVINRAICSDDHSAATFIGVLDIAGFEVFETNSFEQLCINLTNEKLQQFFNHHMFLNEQEEYARERISWVHQDYANLLTDVIDIIERPGVGVFASLEEQCFLPSGKNESFLANLATAFAKGSAQSFQLPKTSQREFSLRHYAGWVTYTVDDWITRNKNPLHDDLVCAVQTTGVGLVQALFAESAAPAATPNARRKNVNFETVCSQFRAQLATLMQTLASTEPHFVRCIKPNARKQPWVVDAPMVLDQLRCNGVLEGVRISRFGYPMRLSYSEFVRRFRVLSPSARARGEGEQQAPRAETERILSATALKAPEDYQLGLTKVFFRANKNEALEKCRADQLGVFAARIQRAWRRRLWVARYRRWRLCFLSVRIIQRNAHLWLRQRPWQKLLEDLKPVIARRAEEERARKLAEEAARREAEAQRQRQLEEARRKIEEDRRRAAEAEAEAQRAAAEQRKRQAEQQEAERLRAAEEAAQTALAEQQAAEEQRRQQQQQQQQAAEEQRRQQQQQQQQVARPQPKPPIRKLPSNPLLPAAKSILRPDSGGPAAHAHPASLPNTSPLTRRHVAPTRTLPRPQPQPPQHMAKHSPQVQPPPPSSSPISVPVPSGRVRNLVLAAMQRNSPDAGGNCNSVPPHADSVGPPPFRPTGSLDSWVCGSPKSPRGDLPGSRKSPAEARRPRADAVVAAAKAPAGPPTSPEQSRRTRVAEEIFSTEKTYVRLLSKIVYVFVKPVRSVKGVSAEDIEGLFSNLQAIRNVHQKFLSDLTERMQTWSPDTLLGDVFQGASLSFKIYQRYINNFENSIGLLQAIQEYNSEFKKFVQDVSMTEQLENLSVESFLILPVQRIPRYVLLLQELIKATAETHPDRALLEEALGQIMALADYINEKKRESENRKKLLQVKARWMGYDGNLFDNPERLFVCDFAICTTKGTYRVWLFSDTAVITAESFDVFAFQYQLDLKSCSLRRTGYNGFVLLTPIVTFTGKVEEAVESLDALHSQICAAKGVPTSDDEAEHKETHRGLGNLAEYRRHCYKALLSLTETEREYIKILERTFKIASMAIKGKAVPQDFAGTFAKIIEFLGKACVVHKNLIARLEARERQWSAAGTIDDIFLELLPSLREYQHLCSLIGNFKAYLERTKKAGRGPPTSVSSVLPFLEVLPSRVREYSVVLDEIVRGVGEQNPDVAAMASVLREVKCIVAAMYSSP
eukprot:m51a1_g1525 putative myosin ii heavy chain (1641) ;mRNA; f:470676-476608